MDSDMLHLMCHWRFDVTVHAPSILCTPGPFDVGLCTRATSFCNLSTRQL